MMPLSMQHGKQQVTVIITSLDDDGVILQKNHNKNNRDHFFFGSLEWIEIGWICIHRKTAKISFAVWV